MSFTTIENQKIVSDPWIALVNDIILKENGAVIGALPKLVSLSKS